ncbi:MAG: maltose/maltodextrin ABC transporter substrate-binding protein MalE [Rhizobacter sp.]|nr:maltose/maltodextrin ABC transporter substrate-binding protein MalE [Bacteriovorax sp.]
MRNLLILILLTLNSAFASDVLIWTSNEGAAKAINEIKGDFEKEYNSKVVVEVLNKDLTSLFRTASLTGKGPDILLWANDVSGELAQSGLIEPLDELPELTKNFLPVSLKAFKYKGRLYGYPYAVESLALFYNKNLVKNAPETFEEIETIAEKMTNPKTKMYGFLYDFKTFFFSFPILNAAGGYIFGENENGLNAKDIGINHQGFIDGLTFLQRLNTKGIIPSSTDRGIAFENFKSDHLAFMIDGPWAIKDLNEAKVNYGIAVLPTFKGKIARPFVGVHGFMIRRSSKNKLRAKEFVEKYLLSYKGIQTFYKFDGRAPARIDVLDALSKSDTTVGILKRSAENGVAMPNIPQMASVWNAMGKALSLSLEQKMPAKESLNLVVNQIK